MAAEQRVRDVGGIAGERCVELGSRPADREAGELDEGEVERKRTAGGTAVRGVTDAADATALSRRRVNGATNAAGVSGGIGARGPGKIRIEERTGGASGLTTSA